MIRVKISTAAKNIPFKKLTPGEMGIWGNYQFFINEPVEHVDWWVTMENLTGPETTSCPPEHTLFVAMENHNMKEYEKGFIKQFHYAVACPGTLNHPRQIYTQQMHFSHLFWSRPKPGQSIESFHKQFKSYDELKKITPAEIPKTKLISAVASSKQKTPGQRLRVEFITALKKHFGDQMDVFAERPNVFGPDTKVSTLKWDAIAPYKYYLALENSLVPHYFTSNMPDAHLAGAYPFYFGHESILEYYPQNTFTHIDMRNIPEAIRIVEKTIANNTYEAHVKDIWKARDLWLDHYSMFPMLANIIDSLPKSTTPPRTLTIRPEQKRRLKHRIVDMLSSHHLLFSVAKTIHQTIKRKHHGNKQ